MDRETFVAYVEQTNPNTVFAPHIGAETKENMGRIGVIVDALIGQYAAKK